MIERNDPLWYKDAIIYQVHVKSFCDANGDGIGDFEGLTQKLDYIRELGATAIWLMPFYPSPLRDDGYDIADYRAINPVYGDMSAFRRFIKAAHQRDLRVITELVINHTSDQHPWFQKARRAKPGSAARDFYVWSDTGKEYADTRIIFLDTERSNWTWDDEAKAYFWHRFYHHQPDLNFDNPKVLEAVLDTMRYWLDMGVDGLRLDAIPYLVERDGTNCENLPETHDVIKKIRAAVDAHYPDRMLLAEANQWPEDTAKYFGDGDECHMSFHFPLMPRMFIALAREDRHPVTDIMRQTPEIPENAQWAIFLRNHDELTLEMVTGKERDYLWSFYASQTRARINLGIRRRLAPLLENDRRKIELLNCLLLSMPGTPTLYYGDEIGMGDNIYLGDRDGVRTPMQWSPDRNGGFSRVDPARLFLPAIQDSVYGFTSVNIESQASNPSSLLNWMRKQIAVRRRHRAFGRGTLRFLYPANRKVLAYLRSDENETILCVANVSAAPQAVELELGEFSGFVPKELGAGSVFPPVGGLPYLLTLPAYGFFWFLLDPNEPAKERFGPTPLMELFTLVLTEQAHLLLAGREAKAFEQHVAPRFLQNRRWFAAKGAGVEAIRVVENVTLPAPDAKKTFLMLGLEVSLHTGTAQHYFAPLVVDETVSEDEPSPYVVARVRRGSSIGVLLDADADPDFACAMLDALRAQTVLKLSSDRQLRFVAATGLVDEPPVTPADVQRMSAEQSNSSILLGDRLVLKLYRRLHNGRNPEIEMTRYLVEEAGFTHVAPILGFVEVVETNGNVLSVAMLQRFVRNQGDAWAFVLEDLKRNLAEPPPTSSNTPQNTGATATGENFLPRVLGERTAELHLALARATDDADFSPEPMDRAFIEAETASVIASAERAFAHLHRSLSERDGPIVELLKRRDECVAAISAAASNFEGLSRTRIHGDFHLGQILIVADDVVFVDFEGEPARSPQERRMKASPLQDVAGLQRSFAYAAEIAARELASRLALNDDAVVGRARLWAGAASRQFIESYRQRIASEKPEALASTGWSDHLRFQLFKKAFYEVEYEANNRPEWVDIPVRGILDLLSERGAAL